MAPIQKEKEDNKDKDQDEEEKTAERRESFEAKPKKEITQVADLAYSDGDELEEESSPEQSLVNIDDIIDEALLDDFLNPEEEETPTPGDNDSTPSPKRR